ncbi:MAG: hypothetical protein AAGB22_14400, partial [Bacteroidota bacterium]
MAGLLNLSSCDIINPEEEIPSFLRIDSINLNITNSGIQGAPTENITEAWVFWNSELIGVFELPAIIPILAAGQGELQVAAGIQVNGIGAKREIYPFYQAFRNQTFTL